MAPPQWLEANLAFTPSRCGEAKPLVFAGPPTQRYLRLAADDDYYIWTRQLDVDPQERPFLELTWSVQRFPQGAALDVHDRTDRPLVVLVSFGPKVPSPGLMPSVPRGLAFFWGETETVGALYTCITPKNGPAEARLQCRYPHVKYIAIRRGEAGSVHTDQVNLLEHFRQQFPASIMASATPAASGRGTNTAAPEDRGVRGL